MNIQIIEGTMEAAGGYSVDGVEYVGDEYEMVVDEAKERAYASGRPILDMLAHLVGEA